MRQLPQRIHIPAYEDLERLINEMLAIMRSQRLRSGIAPRHEGAAGARVQAESSAGGAKTLPEMFRLKAVHDDYVVGRSWDGAKEGTTDVNIAKPYKMRRSIASQVIDGVTWTYTYSSDTSRTASSTTGVTEAQVIVERYLPSAVAGQGDIFFAMKANHTGVTPPNSPECKYIDLNTDARAWTEA